MLSNVEIVYKGIKLYKLKQKAYEYYKLSTRGNATITFEEARRKLTRNIMCARKVDSWGEGKDVYTLYMYGAQKIVTCNDLIIKVKQHKKKDPQFIFHHRKHAKLSRKLDLEKY